MICEHGLRMTQVPTESASTSHLLYSVLYLESNLTPSVLSPLLRTLYPRMHLTKRKGQQPNACFSSQHRRKYLFRARTSPQSFMCFKVDLYLLLAPRLTGTEYIVYDSSSPNELYLIRSRCVKITRIFSRWHHLLSTPPSLSSAYHRRTFPGAILTKPRFHPPLHHSFSWG
jgi:hypothetical protein